MQIKQGYERVFEDVFGARLVNMHVMKIADDIKSSKVLVASFRVTYLRYVIDSRIMIKHKDLLPLPKYVSTIAPAADTLGIMHMKDPSLYIFSQKDSFLMI